MNEVEISENIQMKEEFNIYYSNVASKLQENVQTNDNDNVNIFNLIPSLFTEQ